MRETATLAPRSRALEALDFRDGALFEPSTGRFVGRSGHRYAWARGPSLSGVVATGGTYTAPATVPGYELAADGLGLRLGPDDVLRSDAPVGWLPQALMGEIVFVERGARVGTAGGTLFALADDAVTGARLFLDTSGGGSGFYGITYHNGTSSVTARLTAGQPTAGQVVRLRWGWGAAGLTLRQSIAGAAETLATSGALALPAAWPSGARTRIGRRGATANPAALTLRSIVILPGTFDDVTLDEAW